MKSVRALFILGLGMILSFLTGFMGAPFFRALRFSYGAWIYWLSTCFVVGLSYQFGSLVIAAMILGILLTVGFYTELEISGHGGFLTAGLSVFVSSFLVMAGLLGFSVVKETSFAKDLSSQMSVLTKSVNPSLSEEQMKVLTDSIVSQGPSILVIVMMFSLFFGITMTNRVQKMMNISSYHLPTSPDLLRFKLFDQAIWILMISFLFSFLKLEQKWISVVALNVFNIVMAAYFFQGLAILETAFKVYNVNQFLRLLVYFLIVGQLFLLVSAIGIIDYWIDLRARIKNWRAPQRDHNHEGNL